MNGRQTQHADHKYIEALLQNNRTLIEEIYQQSAKTVLNYVLKNNGDQQDARDLLQDALMAIYEQAKRETFSLNCPFDAYLYYVCRNMWLNRLKKRKRKGVTEMSILPSEDNSDVLTLAEETTKENRKQILFRAMFEKLGESCRNILSRNWKGKNLKEIATELSISYGYARKKKAECVLRLTKLVQEHPEYKGLIKA